MPPASPAAGPALDTTPAHAASERVYGIVQSNAIVADDASDVHALVVEHPWGHEYLGDLAVNVDHGLRISECLRARSVSGGIIIRPSWRRLDLSGV
jgi:hypothetical protein